MKRLILLVGGLLLAAAPAWATVNLDGAAVASGPYYLDQAGETYVLTEDIQTEGSAFVFAAMDVTLDLGGHTVVFGTSSSPYRYGIVIPPSYAHSAPAWAESDIGTWANANRATVRNGRVIQGAGQAAWCVAFSAFDRDELTVSGLDLEIGGDDCCPMRFEWCSDLRIYGNEITDRTRVISNRHQGRAAIDILASEDGVIEVFNNTIRDCAQWGIRVSRSGAASQTAKIFNNTIHPNTVATNGYAIGIHGDDMEAYDNVVRATCGRGIHIELCRGARVYGNDIDVVEEPYWDEYSRVSAHGIKLELCREAEIHDNVVVSRGRVEDADAVSNGAALSITLEAGSNNHIHDNRFIARHERGAAFDLTNTGWYASPLEMINVEPGAGLRLENNVFESNDRLFVGAGWYGGSSSAQTQRSAADVVFRNNTFRRDSVEPLTGREELYWLNCSVSDLRFVDSILAPDVDFRRFHAGWPGMPLSWSGAWSTTVRVLDPDGGEVAGVTVEARREDGTLAAVGTSGADGSVRFDLDEFVVTTERVDTVEQTEILAPNPYEFRALLVSGTVAQPATVVAPGTVVTIMTDGSGALPVEPAVVQSLDWGFQVLATSPDDGAVEVPAGAEIRCLFSHPLDVASVGPQSVRVEGSQSGPVTGQLSYSADGRTLRFTPQGILDPGETVTVEVTGSVRNTDGRFLDGDRDGIPAGQAADAFRMSYRLAAGGD